MHARTSSDLGACLRSQASTASANSASPRSSSNFSATSLWTLQSAHPSRQTETWPARERQMLLTRGLKRGPGRAVVQSALAQRGFARAMPRHGASLRRVFARSFGKPKIFTGQCLSTGATRRSYITRLHRTFSKFSCYRNCRPYHRGIVSESII